MARYIPEFIVHQYHLNELRGSFEGFVLLFDIVDFTLTGISFQKHGKLGAEELNKYLDFAFGESIDIIERYGGFVSQFAGDAFCAIFPISNETSNSSSENLLQVHAVLLAVHTIKEHFRNNRVYSSSLGKFPIQVRQTVSYGTIEWQIYTNELQNEYVFSGNPIRQLAELSASKSELLYSEEAIEMFTRVGINPNENQSCGTTLEYRKSANPSEKDLQFGSTRDQFVNPKYLQILPEPEIRSAAFCFANLDDLDSSTQTQAIAEIQRIADVYNGFVNKYDYTDKGLVAMILFGLPRSEGKTLERICNFALDVVDAVPGTALGVSCGSVFAGFVGSKEIGEYTAFGAPVNLASRLMSIARPGEVLADSFLWQEMHSSYGFSYLGSVALKGIEHPIRYYRLRRQSQVLQREEHCFVGREGELSRIRELVDLAICNQQNTVVYINGDAGIGKSRLASQALSVYKQPSNSSTTLFFSLSSDTVIPKPLEAVKQLLRCHFYYNPEVPKEAAIPMFRFLWSQIDPDDPEMKRIESFLASLLGYEWEGSVWSLLPPEEHTDQLKNAFVYFIRKISQNKSILIHLDDGQWLDEYSRSYFQALSEADICPLIIIASCRYLEDGSRTDLGLNMHRRIDIELEPLTEGNSRALISNILRLNTIPYQTLTLILDRSMGNPLFIEQLSSYLLETESLNENGEIVKELGYLSSFSISDIICSRIDRLTDSVRECLFSASVLGMEFNVKVLSQMLMTDPRQALVAGTRCRIWKDLDELCYIFSHVLIKDIVYQRMISEKLRILHRLAAEAIEMVFKDSIMEHSEEIAYHLEKAGLEIEAVDYYAKAGSWYGDNYNWAKSESLLKRALQIREKVLGDEDPDTASSLNLLACLYEYQGRADQAATLHQKALSIREKVLGSDHPDTAISILNLASSYAALGDFERAEKLYLRALAISENIYGEEHASTALILNNLAYLYRTTDNYEKSESLYHKAMAIREKVLGLEHPDTAITLNNLAILYDCQDKVDQAENLLLQALAIREKILGPDHPDTATSIHSLADLYKKQGKQDQAEQLYIRAIDICTKILGRDHPDTGISLNNLAGLYESQAKYQQAEQLYLQVIEIFTKVCGSDHFRTAIIMNNLAGLYESQGKYQQAEPLYSKCLEIMKRIFGASHSNTATLLNNLAAVYNAQGKYSQAEPLLKQALAISVKNHGAEHSSTARMMVNLASTYEKLQKYVLAEKLSLRALATIKKAFGSEHPETARAMHNLASLYDAEGKYDLAEPMYLQTLEIRERVLGLDHPQTATTINNLAAFYNSQGKIHQAEIMYLRALSIRENALGEDHPDTTESRYNLASFYMSQAQYERAEPLLQRVLDVWTKELGHQHPSTVSAISNLCDLYEKMNLPVQASHYSEMLSSASKS